MQKIDSMKEEIETILEELRSFNRERDWDQFHNGKDPEEVQLDKVKEELADVLNYAFQIADKYSLDIKKIMLDKIRRNAQKYPVEKAKGSAKKYNEL